MNKTATKNFALKAREELTNLVIVQAANLGITASGIQKSKPLEDGIVINGQIFGPSIAEDYQHLIKRIEQNGYHEVLKEAVYTWFNRFVAFRFMELHEYLPIQMRLLSSTTPGKKEPDAVTNVNLLIEELMLNRERVYQLQDQHETEQLFKYVVEMQSRQLEEKIPEVFEDVAQDLYLLLPDGLLREKGFIDQLVGEIPEEDWQEIEIIGWLYQYYISEEKDEIFANIQKTKVGKDEIGAATQIFTPKWIVQYLVDNSLGRLWLENYPNSNLREHLPYYIEDAEQAPEVMAQLDALKGAPINPEDIKIMDPCMGSGHMLLEAFDVMREIYLERGYQPREIPALILSENLYGLDIDKRASQLAAFALVMKAREYDRRFFERDVNINLLGFDESNELPLIENFNVPHLDEVNLELEKLYLNFEDAKLYGSIIKLKSVNIEMLKQAVDEIRKLATKDLFAREFFEYEVPYIEQLIRQYELLNQQYHVVVTNPPYMGGGNMNTQLSKYVKKHYPISKADLFAVMMEVQLNLTKKNYYSAMINQQSWMFLSSYEKLRNELINSTTIVNLVHLGSGTFPEVSGEVVQSVSLVIKNLYIEKYQSKYSRLVSFGTIQKPKEFFNKSNYHISTNENFKKIPGSPIAYWASDKITNIFDKATLLSEIADPKQGIATSDNNKFLRLWYECELDNLFLNCESHQQSETSENNWYPYNKGGEYRKWYGNNDYVINWKHDGSELKSFKGSVLRNPNYYFRECISWSLISMNSIAFRYKPEGHLFDVAGMSCFQTGEVSLNYLLGLNNTCLIETFLSMLAPTINYQVGNIANIPVIIDYKKINDIENLVKRNISISKADWDSFETSWDFETHPFITYQLESARICDSFETWSHAAERRFNQLKANEKELNRIFIDIYGLQDELTSDVPDKDVTVRKADLQRDVKSFLSYLVGVMFGRYSLDEPGLVYAGGEFDPGKYIKYQPDADNFIPLTHAHYFEDDIVKAIEELVDIIYGTESVEDNLQFIAEVIGIKNNETSRDAIRRYFMKDFFKDHKQNYQKRPIYWQMTSGREDAFKGIFYLHRYDEATLARVRTEYVLPLSNTLNELSNQAQGIIDGSASNKEIAKARKDKEKLQKQLQELRDYDLILKKLADQQIELDLDDGVKVNYEKFQNIPVISSETSKETKMNLLDKI